MAWHGMARQGMARQGKRVKSYHRWTREHQAQRKRDRQTDRRSKKDTGIRLEKEKRREAKRRVVLLNERVGRCTGLAKKRRTYPRLCKTQRFAVPKRTSCLKNGFSFAVSLSFSVACLSHSLSPEGFHHPLRRPLSCSNLLGSVPLPLSPPLGSLLVSNRRGRPPR